VRRYVKWSAFFAMLAVQWAANGWFGLFMLLAVFAPLAVMEYRWKDRSPTRGI